MIISIIIIIITADDAMFEKSRSQLCLSSDIDEIGTVPVPPRLLLQSRPGPVAVCLLVHIALLVGWLAYAARLPVTIATLSICPYTLITNLIVYIILPKK